MDSYRQSGSNFESFNQSEIIEQNERLHLNQSRETLKQVLVEQDAENKVIGPQYASIKFKEDIDKVGEKGEIDDDSARSYFMDEGKLTQFVMKRDYLDIQTNCESISLGESGFEKNNLKEQNTSQQNSKKIKKFAFKLTERNESDQFTDIEGENQTTLRYQNTNEAIKKSNVSIIDQQLSLENLHQNQQSNSRNQNNTYSTRGLFDKKDLFLPTTSLNFLTKQSLNPQFVKKQSTEIISSKKIGSKFQNVQNNSLLSYDTHFKMQENDNISFSKVDKQLFEDNSYVTQSWVGNNGQSGLNGIWAKNALLIITLVKKFICSILELSMKFKFSQMQRKLFELIDDKSNDYKYYHVRGYFQHVKLRSYEKKLSDWQASFNKNFIYVSKSDKQILKALLNKILTIKIEVLLPDSFFKILWDFFILSLLVMNVFYIPIKISFENSVNLNDYLLTIFEDVPSWVFLFDIFMNFNTAYYSKGVINKKRSKIFKHYIQRAFAWDLLIVGPFLFSSLFNVKFLNIILLFRSSKILKIISSIEELMNLKPIQVTYMSLIKLVLLIIYLSHIFGCLFYYMHVLQIESDHSIITWVVKCGLQKEEWTTLYLSSVYWAVITMITLGYGDIIPITPLEKLFVVFVALFSCGIFAYAVNSIGYIIQEINKRTNDFRSKMNSLANHMRQRQLSIIELNNFDLFDYQIKMSSLIPSNQFQPSLLFIQSNLMQMKVMKYFQYLHQESSQDKDNEDGQKVLQQCTSSLKKEALTEMYSKVLESRKEFRLNFSKEFLTKLAPKMNECRIGPEEIIFKENEYCKKVYFLMRGNISLQRTRVGHNGKDEEKTKDINIKTLKKGDIFGFESFLSGSQTNVAAKTLNVVSLVYLREDDFQEVINDFTEDKERFQMIKDNLNLMKSCRGLGINCYLCDSYIHQFLNCSYMSYQPNQKKIIKNAIKNSIQIRKPFQRRRQRLPPPISYLHQIQQQALKALFEMNSFEEIEQLMERINILKKEGGVQFSMIDIPSKIFEQQQDDSNKSIEQNFFSNCGSQNAFEEDKQKNFQQELKTHSSNRIVSPKPSPKQINQKVYQGNNLNQENGNKQPPEIKILSTKNSYVQRLSLISKNLKRRRESHEIQSLKMFDGGESDAQQKGNHTSSISQIDLLKSNSIRMKSSSIKVEGEQNKEGSEKNKINCHKGLNCESYDRSNQFNEMANPSSELEIKTQFKKIFMILLNFDKSQVWSVYFPHNNETNVLEQFNKIVLKKQVVKDEKIKQSQNTQKIKHMQQLFSSLNIRGAKKNLSQLIQRNYKSRQSITLLKEQTLNIINN